jgi:hypothetical protein
VWQEVAKAERQAVKVARAAGESLAADAGPPGKQLVTAFLSNPAAARAATETFGESMQRSTRETNDGDL